MFNFIAIYTLKIMKFHQAKQIIKDFEEEDYWLGWSIFFKSYQ